MITYPHMHAITPHPYKYVITPHPYKYAFTPHPYLYDHSTSIKSVILIHPYMFAITAHPYLYDERLTSTYECDHSIEIAIDFLPQRPKLGAIRNDNNELSGELVFRHKSPAMIPLRPQRSDHKSRSESFVVVLP
ncbi:hypothetical protein CDAR_508751 [Caerostris darwini]|uniref:Uncharacterized protein n=1 Tax=Caerostris darwini TaxID=1538125 RepID=A0AAV4N053_9ARAC|nr:hypothetical protein CDAR_508751 [Caerostris darwini]